MLTPGPAYLIVGLSRRAVTDCRQAALRDSPIRLFDVTMLVY